MSALRDLRRPRLWLALWGLAIASVVVLSLTPPPAVTVPRGFDKVEHALAYALLAAGAVQLFARRRVQWRAGTALVAMGIALEFAQAGLTSSRSGDVADAVANTLGVVVGLLTAHTPVADLLQRLERRLPH